MKVLFISTAKKDYSVDGVYIKGLRENHVEVFDYSLHGMAGLKMHIEVIRLYYRHKKNIDYVFVGYDSPRIIIVLWLLCRKKIIYNALCSVYERLIVSRGLAQPRSVKGLYYWFLDFMASVCSTLVMLESEHQIQYFQKLFKTPKKKFFKAWIGVDDEKFIYKPDVSKYQDFTVLFRGRLLPEAGGEVIVRAAKKLEHYPIQILMLANGMELPKIQNLIQGLNLKNLKLVTNFLSDNELITIMQKSHLSLGQLSAHERLERTIPHKAYESLALKLPYLTARNPGIMELLEDGKTCITFSPGDPGDLTEKIVWSYNNQKKLLEIAENGYKFFQEKLSAKKLGEKLLQRLDFLEKQT